MSETYTEIHDGSWGNFAGWATIDYARVGGYEWEEFHVMRGPDGRLYVGSSSGCSCNSFEYNLTPADLVRVSGWHDAVKHLNEWAKPESEWDTDRTSAAAELRSRLAEKRPRARIAHDPVRGFAA